MFQKGGKKCFQVRFSKKIKKNPDGIGIKKMEFRKIQKVCKKKPGLMGVKILSVGWFWFVIEKCKRTITGKFFRQLKFKEQIRNWIDQGSNE